MKSIVELINELKGLDDNEVANRFELMSLNQAYSRKLDFDSWLWRCVRPGLVEYKGSLEPLRKELRIEVKTESVSLPPAGGYKG